MNSILLHLGLVLLDAEDRNVICGGKDALFAVCGAIPAVACLGSARPGWTAGLGWHGQSWMNIK